MLFKKERKCLDQKKCVPASRWLPRLESLHPPRSFRARPTAFEGSPNPGWRWHRTYVTIFHLTESVYEVVMQKSAPAKIRHLIRYISDNKGLVEGFVRKLGFMKIIHVIISKFLVPGFVFCVSDFVSRVQYFWCRRACGGWANPDFEGNAFQSKNFLAMKFTTRHDFYKSSILAGNFTTGKF